MEKEIPNGVDKQNARTDLGVFVSANPNTEFLKPLRPVQTLATTRNIVGANNVVSCCAMLADVRKRSQQVTTCWVFR